MPTFGDVVYNPTAAYVAPLLIDNTFGTPTRVDLIQKVSWEFDADTDEIKSAGMILETLTIGTKGTGEIEQASLDFPTTSVLLGLSAGTYGVTPNRYEVLDILLGGQGLPYFGLIVAFASTFGANLLAGFPKAKLDTIMGFDVDQNKFRIGSAGWTALAPSVTLRKACRYKKYETAAQIPVTTEEFRAFFMNPSPMFDS